ncbi:class F sortase [Streptomyces sp. NPDC017230]|uniref:class F sortase n=1 Tax=unclassified Streptomyces TaxID=2593676 RepID=UPI0037BB8614
MVTVSLWITALLSAGSPARPPVLSVPAVSSPSTAHVLPRAVGAPVRLSVEAASLAATVVPVGVGNDGRLQVPEAGTVAGWWKDTAPPGSRQGATVIAGHLDTLRGPAVFARLARAGRDDPVVVATTAGTVHYRVTAVTTRAGAAMPIEFLSTTGPHRLILVTCAGPYREGDGYRDRLYVEAAPESGLRR